MQIRDLLVDKRPTVSLELFPPKKESGFLEAKRVVEETASLSPDFISVTYGASGGAHKHTVPLEGYTESLGVTALAHLTCVMAAKDEIALIAAEMKEHGVSNILALRGDIPENADFSGSGHFHHAADLVRELAAIGGFSIGAACYPEGHVESKNQKEDIRYLKEKVDAGCDFLTTQMFFDNNILYKFLYKIREARITVPILAGIMPVTNKIQIKRIVELSGTVLPSRFANIVDKFGDDPNAMQQAGIAYATEQIVDLFANGVNGVHVYTMNKPAVAAAILQNISFLRPKL